MIYKQAELSKDTIVVIIPVYNVKQYIRRCVESVLSQTYQKIELILVDDGSSDGSEIICDEYASIKNVKVIHQKNGGAATARNSGLDYALKYSSGKWITFVDSDDWICPDYLELLYNAVKEKNALISVCNYLNVKNEVVISNKVGKNRIMTPEELYCKRNVNAISSWGKLYSKSLFEDIRFPNYKYYEDEFLIYKVLFKVDRLIYIESPLYMYYTNVSGMMRSSWSLEKLVAIKAAEEQMEYFEKFGFKKAYMKTVRKYRRVLSAAIANLEKYYPENSDIKKYRQTLSGIESNKKLKIKMYFYNIFFGVDKLYDYRLKRMMNKKLG